MTWNIKTHTLDDINHLLMDEVMVCDIYFSLVSMEQQDSAILPANHEAQISITINIGHDAAVDLLQFLLHSVLDLKTVKKTRSV